MPGPAWTKKEKKSLRQQVKRERRALGEVEIEDRTVNAIRAQAVRMELVKKKASRAKWPLKQRQRLKELKEEGFSPREIFEFSLLSGAPRSRWSITKKWGRMKLADRERSRKMKKKKIWKPGEKAEFDAYLRKHSKKQTPEEIGKFWHVARSTVARRQNELGVKATRQQVMAMEFSVAKQRRARKRIRRATIQNWARRRKEHADGLVRLADELRESTAPPPEQTCCDCDRSWPRRREFFHIREKKISIGVSRYYKHRCVLCENERRREKEKQKKRRAKNVKR